MFFPYAICASILAVAFAVPEAQAEAPVSPAEALFGASIDDVSKLLSGKCEVENLREVPKQLPTAKSQQMQIDCQGYSYEGVARLVEFVFGDDALDLVFVLTEPEAEEEFRARLTEAYGEPSHVSGPATFYLENNVALFTEPHELLFFSDRVKPAYKAFLEGGPAN